MNFPFEVDVLGIFFYSFYLRSYFVFRLYYFPFVFIYYFYIMPWTYFTKIAK